MAKMFQSPKAQLKMALSKDNKSKNIFDFNVFRIQSYHHIFTSVPKTWSLKMQPEASAGVDHYRIIIHYDVIFIAYRYRYLAMIKPLVC